MSAPPRPAIGAGWPGVALAARRPRRDASLPRRAVASLSGVPVRLPYSLSVRRKVLILNSRRPEVSGTRIVSEAVPCGNVVKSIACKRKITLVNVHSTRMLMAHGFLRRIFEVFDRHETAVDMVSTSEVSVSLTIDNTKALDAICKELNQFSEVSIEDGQAIVCLVGDNRSEERR